MEKVTKHGIPIAAALTAIIVTVSAAMWVSGQLHEIDMRLAGIETQILNRWTSQDQQIWALQLERENAGLSVPSIMEILKQRSLQGD